jgi:hypothetical protein
MEKKTEYIVDIHTGEVIWLTKGLKTMLICYCMVGYDIERKFYFFTESQRKDVLQLIAYESTMVP